MEKTPEIRIQFTNNFGKTFTLGPSSVRFLKLKRLPFQIRDLKALSMDITSLALTTNLKDNIKIQLIRFSQYLLDSDSLTFQSYDNNT